MKILVAEDNAIAAKLLQVSLTKQGHEVVVAGDGVAAFAVHEEQAFDALLTDWMMPHMDGVELIGRVRASARPVPIIIMITAKVSDESRVQALRAGADEYLTKPCNPREVLELLQVCAARQAQPAPSGSVASVAPVAAEPPHIGVMMTATTGGPEAIAEVFRTFDASLRAAFLVVVQGPAWMLETFCSTLEKKMEMPVLLAEDGMRSEPGTVYIAPEGRHLLVDADAVSLRLSGAPPVNFRRPAADPLLRSGARAFGRHGMAVVLTGMGRDGAIGAAHVAAAGGTVLVQDPQTAVAPSMAQTVIDLGYATEIVPLDAMAARIGDRVDALAARLLARHTGP